MSRIRPISASVEPPTDRPVQWFTADGESVIFRRPGEVPTGYVAWCLPASLTEPSGPVHSLEPEELPEVGQPVDLRIRGYWYGGFRASDGFRVMRTPECTDTVACTPDAWRRMITDDEPGDAELLEAARALLGLLQAGQWGGQKCERAQRDLRALVEKRSGKDGRK